MDEQEKQALCEEVGRRVWRCRKEAGLTREALAERLGSSTQYIGDIEQGKKCMGMSYFIRLGSIFNISLDALAYGQREPGAAAGRMLRRMEEMTPLDRGLAAHIILKAADLVRAMESEDG